MKWTLERMPEITDDLLERAAHIYIQGRKMEIRDKKIGSDATKLRDKSLKFREAIKNLQSAWNTFSQVEKEIFASALHPIDIYDFYDHSVDYRNHAGIDWSEVVTNFERKLILGINFSVFQVSEGGRGKKSYALENIVLFLMNEAVEYLAEIPPHTPPRCVNDSYPVSTKWIQLIFSKIYEKRFGYSDESVQPFLDELFDTKYNRPMPLSLIEPSVDKALRYLRQKSIK